ncbi:LAMI_0H12706g1_1 [Lachancea mirantina]|uniref:LAMI_0H12706g1_1 n=1 Tax=Lachancea mirantina TaxID=1230905 RepID=A0A1G4KHS4_9SACH|nr:LAMI_0H12706g1_1 [Lachancea mirantina]
MKNYILKIQNALFKSSLQKSASPVYSRRIKSFQINPGERWVVWGDERSKFLDILGNKYLCDPPLSLDFGRKQGSLVRTEFVKFEGVMPTAHLSARFEFFKDDYDETCEKFIRDDSIGSNAVSYDVKSTNRQVNENLYQYLLDELKLKDLANRWAMSLSNGQMRRARLARSLLKEPDLLLFDDPFLGLDPTATSIISRFLAAYEKSPVVIGLRIQDQIPSWCTHICCVSTDGVIFQGKRAELTSKIEDYRNQNLNLSAHSQKYTIDDLLSSHPLYKKPEHDIIKMADDIELKGLTVMYRGTPVLKDVHWKVAPSSKWHIRGNNGTGKSTLLSLLTADHPQSWNSKLVEAGNPRRTGKSNYFDINKRIGLSSPELHAIFVKNAGKNLSVLESIATGFHDISNNFLPCFDGLSDDRKKTIDMFTEYFDLEGKKFVEFNALSVSDQKLILFIRSLVKMPRVLILDEAFSGMDVAPMLRCHDLLNHWPGTVLVVSHIAEETPCCDHYLHLVEPGKYEVGDIDVDN